MTEFDSTGFSAIHNFFEDKPTDQEPSVVVRSQDVSSKRSGVGSSQRVKEDTQKTKTLANRILKVGRKKQGHAYEEDIDAEEQAPNHDDEEDEGRTGIASNKQSTPKLKIEKRKLGKKERKKLAKEQAKMGDIPAPADATPDEESTDIPASNAGPTIQEGDSERQPIKKPKQKRRKVRSRQKNIRKDNREQKPKHLIAGSSHYEGRPLTEETRAKLQLPSNRKTSRAIDYTSTATTTTEQPDLGMGLAVDDLMDEDEAQAEEEFDEGKKNTVVKKRKRSDSKKSKKKKKYKNL